MSLTPITLDDFIVASETVKLSGNGVAGARPYRAVTRLGTLPAANGADAAGPVLDVRDRYASFATEGYAIVEISGTVGTTAIAKDMALRAIADGTYVPAVAGDMINGRSLDASAAVVAGTARYVRIKLDRGLV